MSKKKSIKHSPGDYIQIPTSTWTFGSNVVKKFDKHIKKSIPFYEEGHSLVSRLSDFFLRNNSVCYEIGTSTGSLIKKLAMRHKDKKIKIVGIDSENQMVHKAREKTKNIKSINIKKGNIISYTFKKSDLIISYYCMQFIPPSKREKIIKKIYKSLNKGGGFLFFEKIKSEDQKLQVIGTSIYTDFKLEQGYSLKEIIAKTNYLKGILKPNSSKDNYALLKKSGFKKIMTIFNYVPFEGIMAIK